MCPDFGRATFETSRCRATSPNCDESTPLIRAVSSETDSKASPKGSSASWIRGKLDIGRASTGDEARSLAGDKGGRRGPGPWPRAPPDLRSRAVYNHPDGRGKLFKQWSVVRSTKSRRHP